MPRVGASGGSPTAAGGRRPGSTGREDDGRRPGAAPRPRRSEANAKWRARRPARRRRRPLPRPREGPRGTRIPRGNSSVTSARRRASQRLVEARRRASAASRPSASASRHCWSNRARVRDEICRALAWLIPPARRPRRACSRSRAGAHHGTVAGGRCSTSSWSSSGHRPRASRARTARRRAAPGGDCRGA